MEVSRFALAILNARSVAAKLSPPEEELEDLPYPSAAPERPGRESALTIVNGRKARVPKLVGWTELEQRRRILHGLVNHELQAVELYAWALVRFAEAPAGFRQDLLRVLLEEQRHALGYIERLEEIGGSFGDYPVSGYFWGKAPIMDQPIRFVCVMSLTFENANLDHSLDGRLAARDAGDAETAEIFELVHQDEVGHVHFGWKWLNRFKSSEQSCWQAYCSNLLPPLHPGRASGRRFHPEPRRAAGFDREMIEGLAEAHRRHQEEIGRPATR